MRRSRFWIDDPDWKNPVVEAMPRPYLADEVFPIDRQGTAGQEALAVLRRFFCKERTSDSSEATDRLMRFLKAPDETLFVIEGDVGVGKTWFVRYHFEVELPDMGAARSSFGVIDMLRAAPDDAETSLYRQLGPILDDYFAQHHGGTENALRAQAQHVAEKRLSKSRTMPEVRAVAEAYVAGLLASQYNSEYCTECLAALEHLSGPMLFLAIDNLDRLTAADQERLLDFAQRALRNARIRLIVPLRTTSSLLRDRFRGLQEVRFESVRLGALKIDRMLEVRFRMNKAGTPLHTRPVISDGIHSYRFPILFNRIMSGESGRLLLQISSNNCRIALRMIKQLVESHRLRGLENLPNVQFAIEAWMLNDGSEPNEAAAIVNLFDNEEKSRTGNGLVRYRVLEYFLIEGKGNPAEKHFAQHFERLGYERARVKAVLGRMLMANVIMSHKGLDPNRLELTPWEQLGVFEITETGRAYEDILLKKEWYFIVAKRGAARNLPSEYIAYDQQNQYHYVSHTHFLDYLRAEQREESARAQRWDQRYALGHKIALSTPWRRGETALRKPKEKSS